jgi:type I restriction-modification system DNA methylase subunit
MKEKYSSLHLVFQRFISEYDNIKTIHNEIGCIENQFQEFKGILSGIWNWNYINKDESSNKKIRNIFEIINRMNLSTQEEMREFINILTSMAQSQSGYIETPDSVKELIIGLIDFNKVNSFAEYCSGTSGIAISIYKHITRYCHEKKISYYGEEINTTLFLISKLLMIINEIDEYEILNKDVMSDSGKCKNIEFDLAISDFPQLTNNDIEFAWNDQRFKYGIPTRSSADWAFIQIVLYHLNASGIGIMIGTKGTLVRSYDSQIRKGIIEDDLIECIITLPPNLYDKSNIGTELIIFNKNKAEARKNKILFINGSEYSYRLNKNQHTISAEGFNKIIEYYTEGTEENHFSKFVDLEKIKEYDYKINPKEYLDFDFLKNSFESLRLKEVAQISRGAQISKEDFKLLSSNPSHYYLNIKDIENGMIYYDETSMITYKKYDWPEKFEIKAGDILLTTKGSAVKIAIVEDEYRPAFISGNITRIRINSAKYNPYILYEFFQSDIGFKMLEGLQTGTTIKLLNTSQLERLEIPLYDIKFMNEIGEEIKSNKREYEKSLEDAKSKFDYNRDKMCRLLKIN